MAGSRLERIGTIYSRTAGLIQSGALNWADRPLWYDIYEAFPPKEEPRYDRPAPNMKLKQIFYKEDRIRAMFHRNNKHIGATNMFNHNYKTLTQRFIDTYQKVEQQYAGNATEEQIYKEAIGILKSEFESKKEKAAVEHEEESVSLSSQFRQAQSALDAQAKSKINLDVGDIFKN
ncbi:unnamed protein product [Acanthoscelides obtectus]|uniref:Small ribosomal subunit protein mS23 n=1 Tax=Acanthoscelides obtectus TaxID=200917 RepID=A0A9P0PRU9_ACAOB|nr:unnamed protein product [Acanthoscelides obtectus]CAK1630198.1 28S ribosomal protein S23, mitochondrial [Acanthoscelides obtectus]